MQTIPKVIKTFLVRFSLNGTSDIGISPAKYRVLLVLVKPNEFLFETSLSVTESNSDCISFILQCNLEAVSHRELLCSTMNAFRI